MAFDIEKMKADGVSSHLIELASMNQETFLLLIARRLENDKFFQQFLASNVGSIEGMYPYAVAAGLMSEEDRKWLIDEGNPYKEQNGEVWLVGNDYIDEDGMRLFVLSNVGETDHVAELFANGNNYQIFLNGTELPYYSDEESLVRWMDTDSTATVTSSVYVQYVGDLLAARSGYMDASTAPTSVEVSVKAK